MKRKFHLIDYAFAHCNFSNNPLPPLQESEYIEWDRNAPVAGETLFVTEANITNESVHNHKGKKVAWLLECRLLNSRLYDWIEKNYSKFDLVLSHDTELVSKVPNAKWIPFGGCWVHKKDWKIYDKNKLVSIVASEKNFLPGHQMRHRIISAHKSKIDLFGRGYNKIENKIESLKDYKYQIVIENASINNYFTEKLIDCFMTGTIPIYWGSLTIDKTFNEDGMIIVDSFEAMNEVMENLEKYDYSMFESGKRDNFERAKKFILAEDYIYENYNKLL